MSKPAGKRSNPGQNKTPNLPMCIQTTAPRPSLHMHRVPARFLSQLIAERNRMATQRLRKRAPVSLATSAYNATRHITTKRMPAGFNRQILA